MNDYEAELCNMATGESCNQTSFSLFLFHLICARYFGQFTIKNKLIKLQIHNLTQLIQ